MKSISFASFETTKAIRLTEPTFESFYKDTLLSLFHHYIVGTSRVTGCPKSWLHGTKILEKLTVIKKYPLLKSPSFEKVAVRKECLLQKSTYSESYLLKRGTT